MLKSVISKEEVVEKNKERRESVRGKIEYYQELIQQKEKNNKNELEEER